MLAEIHIEQLKVNTVVGVYEWEQKQQQPLWIDLVLFTDIAQAAVSDDLHDAIDYAAVAAEIERFAKNNKRQLLEAFISDLADMLLIYTRCDELKLAVSKPQAVESAKNTKIIFQKKRKL